MRANSKYWDDFERREKEIIKCIKSKTMPPVRRVAIFITDKCNFRCGYCNNSNKNQTLSEENFRHVMKKYGKTVILHITGGEPSVVPWLYPVIKAYSNKYRFHLNTNAYIMPPAAHVKRLKVSLDSNNPKEWDCLVKKKGAFSTVIDNIKKSTVLTTTSLTYTLTKTNYLNCVDFVKFTNKKFPKLYALFFSVYKGTDQRYIFSKKDSFVFMTTILPLLKKELPEESKLLLEETIDDKKRLIQGVRFETDISTPCYLSLSERIISPEGKESNCSHLYRDGLFFNSEKFKHYKCKYGCNQRLVRFNSEIEKKLKS